MHAPRCPADPTPPARPAHSDTPSPTVPRSRSEPRLRRPWDGSGSGSAHPPAWPPPPDHQSDAAPAPQPCTTSWQPPPTTPMSTAHRPLARSINHYRSLSSQQLPTPFRVRLWGASGIAGNGPTQSCSPHTSQVIGTRSRSCSTFSGLIRVSTCEHQSARKQGSSSCNPRLLRGGQAITLGGRCVVVTRNRDGRAVVAFNRGGVV
jgi:hypothetical protein